ncbi:hypothetical protein Emag_003093 [Eimeria magna]
MGGAPVGGGPQELYFSSSVEVQENVGPGHGAGVVARAFIKGGELLAWRRGPLVWSARASPDCCEARRLPSPESGRGAPPGGPSEGSGGGASSLPITACDACLRPYDHCNRAFEGGAPSREEGSSAKRCSACNHNISEFAGGHEDDSHKLHAITTTPPTTHPTTATPPAAEAAAKPAAAAEAAAKPAATAAAAAAAENAGGCRCDSLVRGRLSASLSSHLESCAASALLLESLLSSPQHDPAGNKEKRGEGPPCEGPPSLPWTASAKERGGPSADEVRRLLHLLSANVHSVPWTGRGAPLVGAVGGPNACMQGPAAHACVCCQPGSEVALALYGQPLCRFNHSCAPNAWMIFGGPKGPLEVSVVAARSISQGEEIFISYLSPSDIKAQRREKLLLAYNFVCTCVLCCSCSNNNSSHSCSSNSSNGSNSSNSNSTSRNGSNSISNSSNSGNGSSNSNSSSSNSNSNSSSNSSGSSSNTSKDGEALYLPEAFDLQLRGVFCPLASCVEARTTARGDVLLALREAEQQLLQRLTDSSSSSSSGQQQRGVCVASELHATTRRLRLRLPFLRAQCLPLLPNNKPRPLLFPPPAAATAAAAAAAAAVDEEAALAYPELKALDMESDGEVSFMSLEAAAANGKMWVCCNACGTAQKPEELRGVFMQLQRLRSSLQSFRKIRFFHDDEASKKERKEKEILLQQIVPLFAALRRFTHPASSLIRSLTEQLSCAGELLGCTYTPTIGLATAHRQALAAAALYGRLSPQHADRLTTAGRMLLFFAQADSEQEAAEALLCWVKGDAALASPLTSQAAARQQQQQQEEEGVVRESSRARLACEARECFLLACSVFFACSRCELLRAQGRRAEEGIADCERELHALGFTSDSAP